MREVELVVKIPEEQYNDIIEHYNTFPNEWKKWGLQAIKNGTPLPKGHGAIKDVSQIEIPMCEDRAYEKWVQVAINSAPTIIEADTESEE